MAVLLAVVCWMGATPARAADLLQSWRAAQQHDLEFAAAQASYQAAQARRGQSASLWRPTLAFSGTAGRASSDTSTSGAQFSAPGFGTSNGVAFDTSVNNGNTYRWALQARQPLFNRERDAQQRQLELSADVGELEWRAAQQSLMLRTAQGYFDAVLAGEALRVLRRQQTAVERALAEARERFKLGGVPVTDTHEAAARVEAIRAEVLAAEATLQLKQAALSDITGLPAEPMPALELARLAEPEAPVALAQWLAEADAGNLQSRMQSTATEVARQEAAKFSAMSAPSVDLVANLAQDRLSGNGAYGPASGSQNNALIGVQLNIPLYTGGYRSAREDEALQLVNKATAEAQRGTQQVALQTRAAWLGLTVGASRAAALAEALKATLSRLDATRVGREVGDRTTLDLLNAESDAAAAELALLRARVSLLLDRLRLAALAGHLDEAQLSAINASLPARR